MSRIQTAPPASRAPFDSSRSGSPLGAWADGVVIVLMLLTISAAVTGGFRTEVLGARVSVTSWYRTAALALGLLALRHWWQPSPSMATRLWDGWRRWRASPVTRATWPIVVATRIGVLVVGLMAIYAVGYPEGRAPIRVADGEVANLPARFDAGWYLTIATHGYEYLPGRLDRQQNLVFFPAFPLLMHLGSLLVARQILWSGTLISMLAFAWAARYLFRLAREQMDDQRAAVAVAFLATYPFAIFYSAPYTEGLFLLTMLGAWYHLRRDERWAAFAWGFIAGLTRPNGCLLSIPLAFMVVAPLWQQGRLRRPPGGWASIADRMLVAAAPGLGMLVYSAYVYDLTGDPLMWIRLQAAWGRQNLGVVAFLAAEWTSVGQQGAYQYATSNVPDFLNLLAATLVTAAIVPVWRRFGVASAMLLVMNLVPSLASGGWLSVGRATSVLFPIFLWLADAVPMRHRTAVTAGFAGLQVFAAILFFTWRPLF
ncbi:MAG: mannosyltransferase family protein [Acidobacteriota bacterium]